MGVFISVSWSSEGASQNFVVNIVFIEETEHGGKGFVKEGCVVTGTNFGVVDLFEGFFNIIFFGAFSAIDDHFCYAFGF